MSKIVVVESLSQIPIGNGVCIHCGRKCSGVQASVNDVCAMFEQISKKEVFDSLEELLSRSEQGGYVGVVLAKRRPLRGWMSRVLRCGKRLITTCSEIRMVVHFFIGMKYMQWGGHFL